MSNSTSLLTQNYSNHQDNRENSRMVTVRPYGLTNKVKKDKSNNTSTRVLQVVIPLLNAFSEIRFSCSFYCAEYMKIRVNVDGK